VVKEGRQQKTNVPQKVSSIDKATFRKIQNLQQQVERVSELQGLIGKFPALTEHIQATIQKFVSATKNKIKK